MMYWFNKYTFLKLSNISASFVLGFVQLALIAQNVEMSEINFVLFAVSIFSYFAFFDLGFSKPFYARIRQNFCNDQFVGNLFIGELILPFILIPLGALLLFVILFVYEAILETNISIATLVFFSIAFGLNIGHAFLRPLYDAVDRFVEFEFFELLKRISMMILQILIMFDPRLFLYSICLLLSLLVMFFITYKEIVRIYRLKFSSLFVNVGELRRVINRDGESALNYFCFAIMEFFINNWAIYIAPLICSPGNTLLLVIWFRLYRGICQFTRASIDIQMHELMRSFYTLGPEEVKKRVIKILLGGVIILSFFTILVPFGGRYIVALLSDDIVEFANIHWICLVLAVLLNIPQHAVGTFLLNLGKYFQDMRNYSFFILLLLSVIIISTVNFIGMPSMLLLIHVCVYTFSVGVYIRKFLQVVQ